MLYLETIEDQNGDAVEYQLYCDFDAPDLSNAWPGGWDSDYCTFCETCEVRLHVGPECECSLEHDEVA